MSSFLIAITKCQLSIQSSFIEDVMQAFVEGSGESVSDCHSFKYSFIGTFSVLAPGLGPMETCEQGPTCNKPREGSATSVLWKTDLQ